MRRDILWDWIVPAAVGICGFMLGFGKAATLLIFVAASCAWYAAKYFLRRPRV